MPRKRRDVPWLEWRDGTAYVYWYDGARQRTERLSLRTADPVEAQKRFAAFLTEGHDVIAKKPGQGLTVIQALDDYLREHVAHHVVDRSRQEVIIGHLKAHFGDTAISGIDIPASRAYADARRNGEVGGGRRRKDKTGSDSTIRRELVVLQAAANHAAKWKRIGPSATPPTGMPSIELTKENEVGPIGDDDWLTKPELQRVLATATGRLKDFIVLAYDSASRKNAIERLARVQVDLPNSRVNLRSPTENINQRRSKKRRPVVPIGAAARPTYERLLIENKDSPWLFGAPVSMYRPFRNHLTGLGLAAKARPHVLRHTRATHLLHDGVSIYAVAKLLGDTVATVERVYGHHSPEFLAEAMGAAS